MRSRGARGAGRCDRVDAAAIAVGASGGGENVNLPPAKEADSHEFDKTLIPLIIFPVAFDLQRRIIDLCEPLV